MLGVLIIIVSIRKLFLIFCVVYVVECVDDTT